MYVFYSFSLLEEPELHARICEVPYRGGIDSVVFYSVIGYGRLQDLPERRFTRFIAENFPLTSSCSAMRVRGPKRSRQVRMANFLFGYRRADERKI
jgi:hypothetical protein